jgi:cytochrome c oxidase assembly protein subunit 11
MAAPRSEAKPRTRSILDRRIEVRFDANISPDLPVEFAPKQIAKRCASAKPASRSIASATLSDEPVWRAPPTTSRRTSRAIFAKLECFCFTDRVIAPGAEADLPVVFFVDPEIVRSGHTRHQT